ncbi:MAG TPA: class A beta-lactamase [Streptosporangiaceae bacterium]|jgi:beta-lactamase class A
MRQARARRFPARLGFSALAIFTALTGAACGTAPSPSDAKSAASTVRGTPGGGQADIRGPMRKLEAAYHGRIGAYAVDTGTGRTAGYRAYERFPSNSSFKAVLCAAILHKARTSDPGLLDRTLHWTKDDVVEGSPTTGTAANIRDGLSTAKLCRAAITLSDNTAANLLLGQVGGPRAVTRYYRSLGDPVGRLDRTEPTLNDWHPGQRRDTIMPAYMARDLRTVTLGRALVPADRARLTGWLRATTTGDKRIRAGLPKGWTAGDKTGTGGMYATAGDIAIAWPSPGAAPVILSVYTNRPSKSAKPNDAAIAHTATILIHALGTS